MYGLLHNLSASFLAVMPAGTMLILLVLGALWGSGSKKHDKTREKTWNEKPSKSSKRRENQNIAKVTAVPIITNYQGPIFADYRGSYFEDFVFDPEADYAQILTRRHAHIVQYLWGHDLGYADDELHVQVLAEARIHAITQKTENANPPGYQKRGQVELAVNVVDIDVCRPGKSWKESLLFWRRPKRKEVFPMPQNQQLEPRRKKANSGPIYSDGFTQRPANIKSNRPLSGPIKSSCRGDLIESPYVPLHRPERHISPAPLYLP